MLAMSALGGMASAYTVQSMMRFACSQLVVERLDPLVNPGVIGSPHAHQIVGGNSFNATMTPLDHDLVSESTCTSCTFAEDFSNYWTAALYYQARNGSFKRVSQFPNGGLVQNGGFTVYYIPPYDGVSNVTAFSPVSCHLQIAWCLRLERSRWVALHASIGIPDLLKGLRMLAGDPMLRSTTGENRGICHRCFGPNFEPFGGAPCTGNDTSSFPTEFCASGIRTTIAFPTCWDGKNLDSPDHQSHVAYSTIPFEPYYEPLPQGPVTPASERGQCPDTHPVHLPQLMYEVMWDTRPYNNEFFWKEDGSQPFVYAQGGALVTTFASLLN